MTPFDFILYAIGFMLVGGWLGYLKGMVDGLRRACSIVGRVDSSTAPEETLCPYEQ